jgi:hypothetical protein
MALSNVLTKENFYKYTGIDSSDVNDDYVQFVIDTANAIITDQLSKLFSLSTDFVSKNYSDNSRQFIPTGNYQATPEPTVIIKEDGSDREETLTLGEDFRFIFFDEDEPDKNYPIIAIKLYWRRLRRREYLEVTGTYGYSDGIPPELLLEWDMYDIIKDAVLSNQSTTDSGSTSQLKSTKIGDVSVSFDTSQKVTTKDVIEAVNDKMYGIVQNYQYTKDRIPSVIG